MQELPATPHDHRRHADVGPPSPPMEISLDARKPQRYKPRMFPPSRFEFSSRGSRSGTRGRDFYARVERSSVRRNHFPVRRNRSAMRWDDGEPRVNHRSARKNHSADANCFAYVLACQDVVAGSRQQWTGWEDLTRTGGTPPPAGAPVAPVLPASVAAVAPGVEVRFRALVQQIKAHANYNTAIGEALGIEGAEQAGPDLMTLQPEIKVMAGGSEVRVFWNWQGQRAFLGAIEIEVDRGTGWQMLTIDTTPGYHDTEPFPATPARWKYRAIYRVGDQRVGQWSNEVGLNVGG